MQKQNWFETLNAALESENLTEFWPLGLNLSYGEHVGFVHEESKQYISVYRESDGRYERPIHYSTK